jgi:chromosome segregation ATPase
MCLDLTRRVEQLKARIADVKAGIRAAYREERRIAREAKDALLAKERAEAKAEKQQARLLALAGDCGGSKRGYRGFRKPTCKTRDGGPCVFCTNVWEEAQKNPPKRVKKSAKEAVARVKESKVNPNAISNLEAIANRPKDRPKPASVVPANGSVGTPDRISAMLSRQAGSSGGLLGRFR